MAKTKKQIIEEPAAVDIVAKLKINVASSPLWTSLRVHSGQTFSTGRITSIVISRK